MFSALKSGPVLVLSPFWLEPGTEPVIFITKILEPWTGTGKTGPLQSVAVLKPVSIGSELVLVPTGLNQLGPGWTLLIYCIL